MQSDERRLDGRGLYPLDVQNLDNQLGVRRDRLEHRRVAVDDVEGIEGMAYGKVFGQSLRTPEPDHRADGRHRLFEDGVDEAGSGLRILLVVDAGRALASCRRFVGGCSRDDRG